MSVRVISVRRVPAAPVPRPRRTVGAIAWGYAGLIAVYAFAIWTMGDRWWPFAGGIYFLHGIKRVQGMRIITPKWKSAEVKKKALAAVPHKTNGHDDALAARTNHMAGDPQ